MPEQCMAERSSTRPISRLSTSTAQTQPLRMYQVASMLAARPAPQTIPPGSLLLASTSTAHSRAQPESGYHASVAELSSQRPSMCHVPHAEHPGKIMETTYPEKNPDSFELFIENPLTIVIGKTHSKLRINLSSIMPGLIPDQPYITVRFMGHDRFGTFYRDTGSDSSIR